MLSVPLRADAHYCTRTYTTVQPVLGHPSLTHFPVAALLDPPEFAALLLRTLMTAENQVISGSVVLCGASKDE